MFAISAFEWTARSTVNLIDILHLVNHSLDTPASIRVLNQAISAVDVASALSLINVRHTGLCVVNATHFS